VAAGCARVTPPPARARRPGRLDRKSSHLRLSGAKPTGGLPSPSARPAPLLKKGLGAPLTPRLASVVPVTGRGHS
jgi:hypothetical protein